jgi:hypothetical protein
MEDILFAPGFIAWTWESRPHLNAAWTILLMWQVIHAHLNWVRGGADE